MVVKKKKKVNKGESSSKAGIMSRVKPVSESDEFLTAVFYGRSGTGKTTLASTFPKKMIVLDFKDRGTDSIRDVKGIDLLPVDEWSDVEDIYWALSKESGKYLTLALDTVNGMQRLAINKVRTDHRLDEDDALSRRNWGEVAGMMDTWLMNFRDLPMHVVYLAPDRIKNGSDEDDEPTAEEDRLEPEVGPSLTPSVARSLNAAVKVIGNTYIRQRHIVKGGKSREKTEYMLRIGPHPFYITKIRSPKKFTTPGSIQDPSFEKVVKIMRGEE